MKSFIKVVVFLIIPMIVAVLWISDSFVTKIQPGEAKASSFKRVTVKVAKVSYVSQKKLIKSGMVIAYRTIAISTRIMGAVNKIYVKPLDKVKKGELLLKIDSSNLRNNIDALKAKRNAAYDVYVNALHKYVRFKHLYEKHAISKQRYENIQLGSKVAVNNLNAVTSQIKAMEANIAYTKVRAPFKGIITKKLVDRGSLAAPGKPLLVMDQLPYRVVFNLNEAKFSDDLLGQSIIVNVNGHMYHGKIDELSPTIDPITRTFQVKATLDAKNVKNGQYVKVIVDDPSAAKTLEIPASALTHWEDMNYVYKIQNGRAYLTLVRIGKRTQKNVEIIAGLEYGDTIAVGNISNLKDGSYIEIER